MYKINKLNSSTWLANYISKNQFSAKSSKNKNSKKKTNSSSTNINAANQLVPRIFDQQLISSNYCSLHINNIFILPLR